MRKKLYRVFYILFFAYPAISKPLVSVSESKRSRQAFLALKQWLNQTFFSLFKYLSPIGLNHPIFTSRNMPVFNNRHNYSFLNWETVINDRTSLDLTGAREVPGKNPK